MKNTTNINLLKFAACITSNKDIRTFCQVVFVEYDQGNTVIYSTNGHIGIRVIVPNQRLTAQVLTTESINNAYKTGLETLLTPIDYEVRRPPLEKIFVENSDKQDEKVGLDVSYLALITSSLVKLLKDLGTKQKGIILHKTTNSSANFIESSIYLHNGELIRIMVAIMPMRI